jgi:hypothetical protein
MNHTFRANGILTRNHSSDCPAPVSNLVPFLLYLNRDNALMSRRRVLTDAQMASLLALPVAEADPIRHYTLDPGDMAVIEGSAPSVRQTTLALNLTRTQRFRGRNEAQKVWSFVAGSSMSCSQSSRK